MADLQDLPVFLDQKDLPTGFYRTGGSLITSEQLSIGENWQMIISPDFKTQVGRHTLREGIFYYRRERSRDQWGPWERTEVSEWDKLRGR